ncbi:MAG: GNAT family N-acetyltransferase [Ilumatobacter sp.]|uniref:GNAT family N-acetyltransferase n=1 Tax=Ilumatobacter sp. TaxID=1967498 RepID=UPI003299C9E8
MRQSTANPTARADIRRWPLDPSTAHLVLLDVHMEPSSESIDEWVRRAFESPGIERIRTGALFPGAAGAFASHGFVEADRLALLERALHEPSHAAAPLGLATSRLGNRHLTIAANIDAASFPDGWRHDAASLREIATATPQSRRRLVTLTSGRRSSPRGPVGFAITGRAGPNGYLQRIAVHPDARRHGAATLLVTDALDWLVRRGARRAMVNTGITNTAALDLYRRSGFERLVDDLVVVELTRSA